MNLSTVKPEANAQQKTAAIFPMPSAMHQRGSSFVYALLLVAPLLFLPPSWFVKNSLDTPRRLLLLLGAGLLAALIVKSWSARNRLVIRWHPLDLPVVLFFLGVVVSSIGGVYPLISFCGPVWSEDGLALLWMSVIIYFSVKEFLRTPKQVETGVFLLVLAGGFSAFLGYLDFFHFFPFSFNPAFTASPNLLDQRLVATMGNSMFTGTFFAMLIPLAFGAAIAATDSVKRWVLVICLALMLPALLLTQARAAWIGLALTLVIMPIWIALRLQRSEKRTNPMPMLLVILVLGVVVISIGVFVPTINARLRSVLSMEGSTIQTRKIYMQTGWNEFTSHPIQGVGYGNFQLVFQQYRPFSTALEQGMPLNRGYNSALPHNLLLQIAAECGLLGLLPFLLLLFTLYRTGGSMLRGSPTKAWLSAGMLGLCTCSLITDMSAFDNFATTLCFWVGLGLLASLRAEDRTLPERYGALSKPLTRDLTFALNVASLLLALIAITAFLSQFGAAYTFQQGALLLQRVQQEKEADPIAACKTSVRTMRAGNVLSVMNPDYIGYQSLFLAEHTLANQLITRMEQVVHSDPPAANALYQEIMSVHKDMQADGERALRLMDRDPMTGRLLVMDLTQSTDPTDLQEARKWADLLKEHEPRSAETHVISADLYEREDRSENYLRLAVDDATRATDLDPTFKEAWARLAHFHVGLGIGYGNTLGNASPAYLDAACNEFEKARTLGYNMGPADNSDYAAALICLNRIPQAINIGRGARQDPKCFNKLCNFVAAAYTESGKKAEGQQILRQLTAQP